MRRLFIASVVLALSLAPVVTLAAEDEPPAVGAFSPAESLAEARGLHSATLLSDGRILVVGGDWSDGYLASAEVWDPATASFGPAGSLAEARTAHTAAPLPDGRVLVAGGFGWDGGALAAVEVWAPGD